MAKCVVAVAVKGTLQKVALIGPLKPGNVSFGPLGQGAHPK